MNIFQRISNRFAKVEPLPAGTHHKHAVEDEKPYRLHLRLRNDGSGILILNASTVMQLNPTAAEYAHHFIKGTPVEDAAKEIASRYNIKWKDALADFTSFAERIHALISSPDLDPTSFLDFERAQPHTADSTLRLDCALTYRLPAGDHTEHAPVKRVDRELTTAEWQTILDKAWHAGIPHIIFTGGEATLRDDLPQLIAHAEKNGQVCGLLTDGLKLADKKYLDVLLQTGLDHILLVLQPDEPRSWIAIETVVPQDIFITVHFTINKGNVKEAQNILQKVAYLGVENVSFSAADNSLVDEMLELQSVAQRLALNLRWDLPVPYSTSNPVTMETVDDEVPAGAGTAWMYVEPDGDVLPAQGEADKVLGNFLRDGWDQISGSE